jgi:hypothetical protein
VEKFAPKISIQLPGATVVPPPKALAETTPPEEIVGGKPPPVPGCSTSFFRWIFAPLGAGPSLEFAAT